MSCFVHAAEQAVGLHQPGGGDAARDIEPAGHQPFGILEMRAAGRGAPIRRFDLFDGGVRPEVGDDLEGFLVELVGAGSPQCGCGMDLGPGEFLGCVFGEQREIGGLAGGESGLG